MAFLSAATQGPFVCLRGYHEGDSPVSFLNRIQPVDMSLSSVFVHGAKSILTVCGSYFKLTQGGLYVMVLKDV